ncbi:MAG TPA: transcription elongation factor GreA [Alphaproteobacteria bacterium]|jgi:transcription elongation factor GreA|nr:transcription elongation factor GreA [Alphaproteobacteria bacterium]
MVKLPITAAGYTRLEEEIKHLKTVERPAVIEAIAEARSHGDLSENAEYHAARERQSFIEGRIADLESRLSLADIIDTSKFNDTVIRFGAHVKVVDEATDQEQAFQIVGEYEADIDQGLLALTAPLPRALIGKNVGDSVEVQTPKGPRAYEILEVKYG